MRKEYDTLGELLVEDQFYWGANTQRSIENFPITQEKMPYSIINALAKIKKCAALANQKIGKLDSKISKIICQVCDEIIEGKLNNQFPLKIWQTGSGTQTNMNLNEVISNRGNEIMKMPLGKKFPIHPNDHVNLSQSSNDTFPTAIHIAIAINVNIHLLPTLKELFGTLELKSKIWKDVIKIARTHFQDATPITLGQEFSAFAYQIKSSIERIEYCISWIYKLAQGATAVGTGINCSKEFVEEFINFIRLETNLPFTSSPNKFASISSHDDIVFFAGSLNSLASSLIKISNDITMLSSGPMTGLGEITIPANEAGSSIMPSKVNPTQCEAVNMVCYQVISNYTAIVMGGSSGHFQLNTFKPLIAKNVLHSIELLSDAVKSFNQRCVRGIEPNYDKLSQNVSKALMLATALNQYIGYEKAAIVVKKAFEEKISLLESVTSLGFLDQKKGMEILDPKKML